MNLSARVCEFLICRQKECLCFFNSMGYGRIETVPRWFVCDVGAGCCFSSARVLVSYVVPLRGSWFDHGSQPFAYQKVPSGCTNKAQQLWLVWWGSWGYIFLLIVMRTTRFQSMFDSCSSPLSFRKKRNVLTLCLKPHGHSQEILDLFLTCKGLSSFFVLTFSFIFWWSVSVCEYILTSSRICRGK